MRCAPQAITTGSNRPNTPTERQDFLVRDPQCSTLVDDE